MKIGIPSEVKPSEFRVAMTPAGVLDLTKRGHQVFVQEGAGLGTYLSDEAYREAGASIVSV